MKDIESILSLDEIVSEVATILAQGLSALPQKATSCR